MQYWVSIMCIWFVAYNDWVYNGCFTVITVSVNSVSTILSLTQSAINGLHCHILSKQRYRLAWLRQKQMTPSLPHPKNERWQYVNDLWHWVKNQPLGGVVTVSHSRTIGRLSMEQWWWQGFYYVVKMSVNRVSTTLGPASWKMLGLCGDITP
jgi:hypothetical protein